MTPELIAILLKSSLPVRLALLNADPTGAGWYVNKWGRDVFRTAGESIESVTDAVADGTGAWLPCSPLAIVEHARGMFGETAFLRVARVGGKWRMALMRDDGGDNFVSKKGEHECPHTAAVALLREVVG